MSCRMGFQFSYGSTFGHECGILAASTERLTMRATPDFDFALGETADMIRETTARFADEKIAPLADSADREDWFPRAELWTAMGELGLPGLTGAEPLGGLGPAHLEHVTAAEEVSRPAAACE